MQLNFKEIIQSAKEALRIEGEAVLELIHGIGDEFAQIVACIVESKGRLVVTGVGKSAIIGAKLVATFNSTGTPALFMHGADAIHGDFGMVQPNDVILCISQSGNTPEIQVLVSIIAQNGNKIIALTGNKASFLAKNAQFCLHSHIQKEACPHNLAPTTSTTAQLALGDALAICLLNARGFSPTDFARTHPGGALGKKLTLKLSDIYPKNQKPQVRLTDNLQTIIVEISGKRLGATAVLNHKNELQGIITDGDLRRAMQKYTDFSAVEAQHIFTPNPKTIAETALATDALELMQHHNITQIIVTSPSHEYVGFVHIHDLLNQI